MSAEDRGWGPGWPNCQRDKIVSIQVAGVSFPGGVRQEVAPIFKDFLIEFNLTVESLVKGWCWGFACRAIRGTNRPSNHSWGLALDINAPRHPMGKEGTFSAGQARQCRRLAEKYGLRWGGDYRGRKDEMHFEYMGTRSQALAYSGNEELDMFCEHGDEGPKVEAMQWLVLAAGGKLPVYGADADYGDETAAGLASVVGGDGRTYGPEQYAALLGKVGGGGGTPHPHAPQKHAHNDLYVTKAAYDAHRHDEGRTSGPR